MRGRTSIALSLAAAAACVLAAGFSAASFTDTSQNSVTVSAAADWVAPTAEASTIAQVTGGLPGYVKAGSAYYVYANVTDSGNPASGVASVKANVTSVTSGQSAVSLVAGSYSAGGVSYDYRSASLTAGSSISGKKNYTLELVDSAKNTASQSFSVTAVKGAFEASDFATDNVSGGTSGKPEKGDTVSFEFNRAPDPKSIVTGWDGSGAKSVIVTIEGSSTNDTLSVSGATIGGVELKGDFTESQTTFTASSMSLEGSEVTIVLGASSAGAKTNTGKTKPSWLPSTSIYDVVGDKCASTAVMGSNVKQF